MDLKLCEIKFTVTGTDEKRMSFGEHTLDDGNYVFHKNIDTTQPGEKIMTDIVKLFTGAGKVSGLEVSVMKYPLVSYPTTAYLKQSENSLAPKIEP